MSELELNVKLAGYSGCKRALLAVLDTVESHPVPSKREDPTGEIVSAIECFGDAIKATIEKELPRDE